MQPRGKHPYPNNYVSSKTTKFSQTFALIFFKIVMLFFVMSAIPFRLVSV